MISIYLPVIDRICSLLSIIGSKFLTISSTFSVVKLEKFCSSLKKLHTSSNRRKSAPLPFANRTMFRYSGISVIISNTFKNSSLLSVSGDFPLWFVTSYNRNRYIIKQKKNPDTFTLKIAFTYGSLNCRFNLFNSFHTSVNVNSPISKWRVKLVLNSFLSFQIMITRL